MNREKKIILAVTFLVIILSIGVCYFFYFRINREMKLMKEGEKIVNKIEEYKKVNSKLPNSLSDIDIEEQDGMDVIYYYKRDSINYTISFPISAEQHKFYYSDSKKWEKGYRDMK